MNKKSLCLFLLIFISLKSFSQSLLGYSNINYSGIYTLFNNPANSLGACKFDLSLGISGGALNNYFGINRNFFMDFNKADLLKRSNTQYFEGNDSKNLYGSTRFMFPSFLARINSKSAMAFTWVLRNQMNFNNVDIDLSNILYNHFQYQNAIGINNSIHNIYASSHTWVEYGLNYAFDVFVNDKHELVLGSTIKFLQGVNSFYANAKNLNYELTSDSTMNLEGYIEYGHSKNPSFDPTFIRYEMNGKPSFGIDFGVNYLLKSKKYLNNAVVYVLKLSAAIVDVGSVKYDKFNSNDFYVNINNWNVRNLMFDYNNITQNIDDTIRKRFGFNNSAPTTYKMKLPTSLILQADCRLSEKAFINFSARIPQKFNQKVPFSKEYFYLSLAPRIENIKGFALSMPITYYPMFNNTKTLPVSTGFIIKLGWIAVGTNHLSDLIFSNYLKGFDFFAVLNFSTFKDFVDKDKDGMEDKFDLCPEIAGKKELFGCPDRDNDSIPDKDDKCPDLAGTLKYNGCPDKDGDGIIDPEDNCPDVAGLKSLNGCPDADNDSIPDKDDKCPNVAGIKELNGCPPLKIDGNILLTENIKDVAKKLKLYLLNQNCIKQDSTYTDENGYFKFITKDTTQNYYVKVDENNEIAKEKVRFFMAKNDTIIRVSKSKLCDKFVFMLLPYEKYRYIDLKRDGNLHLGGTFLVIGNTTIPLKNVKITIRNKNGDIIDTIYTNEFGSFTFRYLDYDQTYLITFEDNLELPDGTKIILTNKNGKEVKSFIYRTGEKFNFELLPYDKVTLSDLTIDDSEINITLKGYLKSIQFEPYKNAKIIVTDEEKPITEISTDSTGKFIIENLNYKKGITFVIPQGQVDTNLNKALVVFITDAKNRIIKRLVRAIGGDFKIQLLDLEKTTLSEYQINDPWLSVLKLKNKYSKDTIKIREKINYALNAYKPDDAGFRVLDKVVQIMLDNPKLVMNISSHTDSRGNDKHNMELSIKRAKFAYEYITSKGVSADRLSYNGFGESKLLNECGNNVKCPEEKHAENRRTEFDIHVKESNNQ